MPGLWLDARFSSIASFASDRCIQAESVDGADTAFYRLRFPRVHQKRDHGAASTQGLYSAVLSVGLARAASLFLDLSQHALVSVRVLI